ncbi:toll/interleukin-1 receptor domain-containing protein [Paractinoplanes deccanensis]|uniref:toll/interleukin-1 receptor domain-containing protein n=1 Tax=Paractinoplanes deccanensis TaxID=113561 RepID=UPI001EF24FFD|nr:toll/interleukin-1 receptor domain-containing protein [Actinoplanes deccanensis]
MSGPLVYLSYERTNREVGERLRRDLAATTPWMEYFDDSQLGSADRWESEIRRAMDAADVLVQLIGGSGRGEPAPSAAQSSVFDAVRRGGGRVISVLVEGDPRAIASSPIQAKGPVLVLRDKHWADDVGALTALIAEAMMPAQAPDMLPPLPSGLVDRAEVRTVVEGLRPGSVVAIMGPAGSGKTVLAQAAARQAAVRFPDGVLWASLDQRGGSSEAVRSFLLALNIDSYEAEDAGPSRFGEIVRERDGGSVGGRRGSGGCEAARAIRPGPAFAAFADRDSGEVRRFAAVRRRQRRFRFGRVRLGLRDAAAGPATPPPGAGGAVHPGLRDRPGRGDGRLRHRVGRGGVASARPRSTDQRDRAGPLSPQRVDSSIRR